MYRHVRTMQWHSVRGSKQKRGGNRTGGGCVARVACMRERVNAATGERYWCYVRGNVQQRCCCYRQTFD